MKENTGNVAENLFLIIDGKEKNDISCWENWLIHSKIYSETFSKSMSSKRNFCFKNTSLAHLKLLFSEIFKEKQTLFGFEGSSKDFYILINRVKFRNILGNIFLYFIDYIYHFLCFYR